MEGFLPFHVTGLMKGHGGAKVPPQKHWHIRYQVSMSLRGLRKTWGSDVWSGGLLSGLWLLEDLGINSWL